MGLYDFGIQGNLLSGLPVSSWPRTESPGPVRPTTGYRSTLDPSSHEARHTWSGLCFSRLVRAGLLIQTPRKGARLSFWATPRTLDGGASTMLARDSFIGLSRCRCRCWGNGLIASKERNKNYFIDYTQSVECPHLLYTYMHSRLLFRAQISQRISKLINRRTDIIKRQRRNSPPRMFLRQSNRLVVRLHVRLSSRGRSRGSCSLGCLIRSDRSRRTWFRRGSRWAIE